MLCHWVTCGGLAFHPGGGSDTPSCFMIQELAYAVMLWATLAFRCGTFYKKINILIEICLYLPFSGREPQKSYIPEVPGSIFVFITLEIK